MSMDFFPTTTERIDFDDDNFMNVSNTNGWLLLRTLGIEPDYSGNIDAEELLNRIDLVERQVVRYFGHLRKVADVALTEGDGTVTWA